MPSYFVGIDLSKSTIDFAILNDNNLLESFKTENTVAAIKDLLSELFVKYKSSVRNTVYCAENMGLFATHLLNVLEKKKANICMESPLRIKYSMGIQRGKTDKLDAIKIAKYAYINRAELQMWQGERNEIKELKLLRSLRDRLVNARTLVKSNSVVQNTFLSTSFTKAFFILSSNTLNAIGKDILATEERMRQLIKNDTRLNRLFDIVASIPHIGSVIAIEIIICTNEFKNITTAKKFASYAGIAPFEWQSGTSVRGKTKVSSIGDKRMKKLLHMASIGYTKRKDSTLGKYYDKKVKEGKHKMSVLNAIRNKLVHRIYACVCKNELYTDIAR